MPTITCSDLTHIYPNGVMALDRVTLQIGDGITGIVGLNGAGKSTLLGILLGALVPTAGTAAIDESTPAEYRRRSRIGYIAEGARFEPYLRTHEFLGGLAALCGADDFDRFGTDAFATRRLGELSQGQRRRVEIAAALMGGASLLLLDEPTNGLDPVALRELRDILGSLRRPDVTVLISSHHLDELERIVDRIVLMAHGHVIGLHSRDDVLAEYGSFDAFGTHLGTSRKA